MARDDRMVRDGDDLGDRRMARMCDIDDHAERFHPPHHLPPERGEAALGLAVHRAGDFGVEEMREPRHAEAGRVERIEIG